MNQEHSCKTCGYSRQPCNFKTDTVVGCAKIEEPNVNQIMREGNVYKGWFYINRLPGNKKKSETVGEGAMVNGILCDDNLICKFYVGRS